MSSQPPIPIETAETFLTSELEGVVPLSAWGEVSYFYNPGHKLKRGTYFATIKQKDGNNDKGSSIDREGVWRLNIGLTKRTYQSLFGPNPDRPGKGGVVEGPWDFKQLDILMPHPVYGWMSWVAVLNPSQQTWEQCIPLIRDAHAKAKTGFEKRVSSGS
ncbi:MAG: DUF6194 family protein [Alphaproteobacteria bacterium]|jgi:hypothetical protein